MGKLWPFKKKAAEAEAPEIVTYERGDTHADEILSDRSHVEDEQYKAALDLLTNPHLGGEPGGEITEKVILEADEDTPDLLNLAGVPRGQPTPQPTPKSDTDGGDIYVQSGDGYWYRIKSDGSYDSTAHSKDDGGSYKPYRA